MNLLEMVTSYLGDDGVEKVGQSLGSDKGTAASALAQAVPFLVGAMARNTKSDEGAAALNGALDRDHDGSILDNLGSLINSPEAGAGSGILRHVLGSRQPAVQQAVAQKSGLSMESAGKLLAMAAPMIMGYLGKQKRENNLGAGDIAGMLQHTAGTMEKDDDSGGGIGGMVKGLLDADGDGSIMDDVGGIIGKLF
ncbi:MAG: DUF937 domain-containing protein [Bacteroidota bacterium]